MAQRREINNTLLEEFDELYPDAVDVVAARVYNQCIASADAINVGIHVYAARHRVETFRNRLREADLVREG